MRGVFLRVAALIGMMGLGPSSAASDPLSIEHEGLVLNGNLMLAPEEAITDGVVLMVHGTMAHHGMELMEAQQKLLAERGWSSLAVTLGLGLSDRQGFLDCGVEHRHRHEDAVREISAWRQWLAENGANWVVLMGHSRGGNQVARAALSASGGKLRGLVLLAPMTWNSEAVAEAYQARHGQALDLVLSKANGMTPDQVMAEVGFLSCPDARVLAGSFLSYYADDPQKDTPSLLPHISVPTVVIAAEEDRVVPNLAQHTAAVVDADTQFVMIEGADHMFLDFFAEDAADAIDAFLSDLP